MNRLVVKNTSEIHYEFLNKAYNDYMIGEGDPMVPSLLLWYLCDQGQTLMMRNASRILEIDISNILPTKFKRKKNIDVER